MAPHLFFWQLLTRKQSANSRSSLPAAHVGTIGHAAVASVPGVPTRTLSLLAPALLPMPLLAWSALPMPMVHRTCRASTSRVLVALCSVVRLICLRACPAASCPCGTLCPSHAGTRHCKQVSKFYSNKIPVKSTTRVYVSSQSIRTNAQLEDCVTVCTCTRARLRLPGGTRLRAFRGPSLPSALPLAAERALN